MRHNDEELNRKQKNNDFPDRNRPHHPSSANDEEYEDLTRELLNLYDIPFRNKNRKNPSTDAGNGSSSEAKAITKGSS